MSCAHKNLDCKIGVIIGKDIRPVDDEISWMLMKLKI
jgi:hypothetical protein